MLKEIDSFLHGISMYILLICGLSVLAAVSIILSLSGTLDFEAIDMLISLASVISAAMLLGPLLKWAFGGPITQGSTLITALITFFLFTPTSEIEQLSAIVLAVSLGLAGKYILAIRKRHLFNPAALGAAVVGWIGILQPTWWVASRPLLVFTLMLGFLILRKLHRFLLFFSFLAASVLTIQVVAIGDGREVIEILRTSIVSFPLIFLGTVMLTEPMTTPSKKIQQISYGALVGLLFGSGWHVGSIFMTPELALLLGNLFAYSFMIKQRTELTLIKSKEIGPNIYSYLFRPNRAFSFQPGQYLEVTLDNVKRDSRVNRRSFSIASSPSDENVLLGIKHYDPSSEFKKTLSKLSPGDKMYAHQLQGVFTLPSNPDQPVVMIAGGIGITPFRSMLSSLESNQNNRQMVLFYQVSHPDEIVFKDVLKTAKQQGVKIVPVLSTKEIPKNWKFETGFIDSEMLNRHLPSITGRTYYISGPPGMVAAYKNMLTKSGVSKRHIVTDYFSGY